jgi:hypothetical protein
MSIKQVVDLSDQGTKRMLINAIRALEGPHRVEIVRYRPRRSDRQNSFYWPAFCEPFAEWLSEQQGKRVDPEEAHEIFKRTFLEVSVVDEDGVVMFDHRGDPLQRVRSTQELDTAEFAEYLDNCAQLMVDLCGLAPPDADVYKARRLKGAST